MFRQSKRFGLYGCVLLEEVSWIEKQKNAGVVVFSELNSWACNRVDKKGSHVQSLYQELTLAERKEAVRQYTVF